MLVTGVKSGLILLLVPSLPNKHYACLASSIWTSRFVSPAGRKPAIAQALLRGMKAPLEAIIFNACGCVALPTQAWHGVACPDDLR